MIANGGTATVTMPGESCADLVLGSSAGSGSILMSGSSGQLSVTYDEVVGGAGTGTFTQNGGVSTVSSLSIGASGVYLLAGGTLQANGSPQNLGTFAGGNTPATLCASGILDMSSGTWQNLGTFSLSMSANSLLIVPAGFNTLTGLANYCTLGLTHTVGTTLVVPAGQGFSGLGSINDPVNCQGTIVTSNWTYLNNGLVLSGNGSVNLGNGNLTVNDSISGMSGGSLATLNLYVGSGGTGTFTQTGGTNSINGSLTLGVSAADNGTYNLSGNGILSAPTAYVGYSGRGAFMQSGGINNITSYFYLGYNSGSSGTYNQSGGLNTSRVYVGYNAGSSGTYNQSGGTNTGGLSRLQCRQ